MRNFWDKLDIILDVLMILAVLKLISAGNAAWTDYFTVFGLIAMWILDRIIRKKNKR